MDSLDGVIENEPNPTSDYVELRYDADVISMDEIKDALEEVGYRPASHRPVDDSGPPDV